MSARRPFEPAPHDDAAIVRRVLGGDVDAFQGLVRRHQAAAFRLCNAIVLDADAAADLVQDAFVRSFVNLARCRQPGRFRVWLLRIVRHRALDHLRERRRRDVSLSEQHVLHQVDATRHVAPESADRLDERAALDDALARLSQPLREAFVLRYVEELSTAEVAELLGTGASAVKMRVQRARAQLQRLLEDRADGPDVTGRPPASSDVETHRRGHGDT